MLFLPILRVDPQYFRCEKEKNCVRVKGAREKKQVTGSILFSVFFFFEFTFGITQSAIFQCFYLHVYACVRVI